MEFCFNLLLLLPPLSLFLCLSIALHARYTLVKIRYFRNGRFNPGTKEKFRGGEQGRQWSYKNLTINGGKSSVPDP